MVISSSALRADELDTLKLKFSESIARDENLYRLPDGVTSGNSPRADTVRTDVMSFSLDKPYGLQSLHLGAAFGNVRYQANGALNRQTKNLDSSWSGALTPELVGGLSAARVQSQNSFTDYQTAGGSVNTTDTVRANGDFGGSAPIHVIATASHVKSSNSVLVTQTGNTSARVAELGAKYISAAGNSVTYLLRRQQVEWLNQPLNPVSLIDNRAKQTDHELQVTWQPSGATTANLVVTRLAKRYDNFGERDYSGTAGQFSLAWQPTSAVRVALNRQRTFSTWLNSFSSYSITDSTVLTPSWQISGKTALHLSLGSTRIRFLGPVVPQTTPLREDRTPTVQLGLDWTPLRNLSLSASWQRERRDSNQAPYDYSDRMGTVSATLQF